MKAAGMFLFAVMCLAQWFVPGRMILDSESVMAEGKLFKFKTRPVDPYDPFRGKYITLNFEARLFEAGLAETWEREEEIYVQLGIDSADFAMITGVSKAEPGNTEDFVKAHVDWLDGEAYSLLHIRYPFERFYLEESKAAKAEEVYREVQTDTTQVAYALVSVKRGKAVIKDVMINGQSIVEIVRRLNEREGKSGGPTKK